jgi:hypothetical protein
MQGLDSVSRVAGLRFGVHGREGDVAELGRGWSDVTLLQTTTLSWWSDSPQPHVEALCERTSQS